MANVILHIGSPKTATTTLQDLFFDPLHHKGKINYLGKLPAYQGKINYLGKLPAYLEKLPNHLAKLPVHPTDDTNNKKELLRRKVSLAFLSAMNSNSLHKNRDQLKSLLNSALDKEKTNVLSQESLFGSGANGQFHYHGSMVERIQHLRYLLQDHSVTVFCMIRRQPEYMYSLYVQGYRYIRKAKNRHNIKAYVSSVLSDDTYRRELLGYSDTLKAYRKTFGAMQCLLYEEFVDHQFACYQKIATLLNITITQNDVPTQKQNAALKTRLGYVSCTDSPVVKWCLSHPSKLLSSMYFEFYVYAVWVARIVIKLLRLQRDLRRRAERRLKNEPFLHLYLTEKQKRGILNACKATNLDLVKENFFTMQDLKKYGYL